VSFYCRSFCREDNIGKNIIDRIYSGVSVEVGNQVASLLNGKPADDDVLDRIDFNIVGSHFLDQFSDQPRKIVLEQGPDGAYKVSEHR